MIGKGVSVCMHLYYYEQGTGYSSVYCTNVIRSYNYLEISPALQPVEFDSKNLSEDEVHDEIYSQ